MNAYIQIIIISSIALLLILSGVFSFSEMAIASSSKIRLKTLSTTSKRKIIRKGSKRVLKMIENINETITGIVIFNNIVNVLVTTLMTSYIAFLFVNGNPIVANLVSFLIMTVLIIVVGELVPKMLAKKYPEIGSTFFSGFISVAVKSLFPFTWVFKKIVKQNEEQIFANEEELEEALEEAKKIGITSEKENQLMTSVMKLDDTKVEEVMITKDKSFVIKGNVTILKVKEILKQAKITRIPILNKKGEPINILNSTSYMIDYLEDRDVDKNKHLYPVTKFKREDTLQNVFDILKKERQKIGVIVNENNVFIGLITVEDIIETTFGKIYDEFDISEKGVYEIYPNHYLVAPNVKIKYVFEKYIKNSVKNGPSVKRDLTMEEWMKHKLGKNKLKAGDFVIYDTMIVWAKQDKLSSEKNQIIFEINIKKRENNTK